MTEWPLWKCIPPGRIGRLVLYQRDNFGNELELLPVIRAELESADEIESLEEIDRIIRKPPEKLVKVK